MCAACERKKEREEKGEGNANCISSQPSVTRALLARVSRGRLYVYFERVYVRTDRVPREKAFAVDKIIARRGRIAGERSRE